MSRTLIVLGVVLIVVGVLWPWLGRIGLGRLPGDIVVQGKHVTFYFPIATALVISILLSLILWLINR